MRLRSIETREDGFTLLEVAVAGSVALLVIMGLFSAIRTANDQTVFIEKKKDERNLVSDMRYMLSDDLLCREHLVLNSEIRPGEKIKFELRQDSFIKENVDLSIYGIHVDAFNILDGEQIREVREFESWKGKNRTIEVEKYEVRNHRMVRVSPPLDKPGASGSLFFWNKEYYVDLELRTSSMGKKAVHFKPERVARVSVNRYWDAKTGDGWSCTSPDAKVGNSVAPIDLSLRLGASVEKKTGGKTDDSDVQALMQKISRLEETQKASEAQRKLEAKQESSSSAAAPIAPPAPEPGRSLASLAVPSASPGLSPSASGTPRPVNVAPEAPTTGLVVASSCAVNMTASEAAKKGFPIMQHGETTSVPIGDCQEKKFLCWEGNLQDLGLPARKQETCGAGLVLTGEENARQLGAKTEKPPEEDCAVNISLSEAKRHGFPTFKSGERMNFASGECEEKSFVCWDGHFRDEGKAPIRVPGCKPVAKK